MGERGGDDILYVLCLALVERQVSIVQCFFIL